jgi:hypothetical protein
MANKIKLAGTSSNTFSVGLQGATISSNAVSTPYTLTLPANTGTNTQVLTTDGTGNLSWTNAGGGGGGSPGGANTQLQYNNNGTFGGISTVTYALGNLTLGNVANVKVTGGVSQDVIRTDGTGNLSFASIAESLVVVGRAATVTVAINNYTMNVEARSGNVLVYVN